MRPSRILYGVCQRGNLRCLPGIDLGRWKVTPKSCPSIDDPRRARASMCRPRRARRVRSAALARRERSHAQARPFFTGEASVASTCLYDAP
jgi:hypothetical protein